MKGGVVCARENEDEESFHIPQLVSLDALREKANKDADPVDRYACTYVCMYVYVCMYAYVCMCMYVGMYVSIYLTNYVCM